MTFRNSALRLFGCSAILLLGGCWTVRETERPATEVGRLPEGRDVKVQVAGFDATVTTYDTAYTYGTATGFGGGWYDRRGRYRYGGLGTAMYSSTTYVPRREATSAYRDRATDALEHAGCIVQTEDPQYRVEVRFEGPFSEDGDAWAAAGWIVCTVFTADYGAADWSAKLKIHDMKTGKLVLERAFDERDEAVVWGPVPIFSPAFSSRTSASTLKDNCLTALTDRAVAEAIAFLATK